MVSGERKVVVAIDGPAGAGKSTAAKLLASRLGFIYIDSGALYRTVTWLLLHGGITEKEQLTDATDEAVISSLLRSGDFLANNDAEGATRLFFQGHEITADVRSEVVEKLVPFVAQRPRIRKGVNELQHSLAEKQSAVVEGRDIGTVVFPAATLKFFLDADIKARGRRRYLELRRQGRSKPLADCIRDIETRDALDKQRQLAPLEPAPDAVVIDTSRLTSIETLEQMLGNAAKRGVPLKLKPFDTGYSPTLLAVSGMIGVGKSTFCAWLGAELKIPVFTENPDDNPYIRRYYEQSDRWALHSQMWFLQRKYELLSSLEDQRTPAIIDRTLHEDYIFARVVLAPGELDLYERWYRLAFSLVPAPTLIISLEASVPMLVSRIVKRGRSYEQIKKHDDRSGLSEKFLGILAREYEEWIRNYADSPVIPVDTERNDIEDPAFRSELLYEVRELIPQRGAPA